MTIVSDNSELQDLKEKMILQYGFAAALKKLITKQSNVKTASRRLNSKARKYFCKYLD